MGLALEQQTTQQKFSVKTVVWALAMVIVSVSIVMFICVPGLWDQIMASKDQILKGAMIGASLLPVFLVVVLKGGRDWTKKAWCWISIAVAVVAVVAIVLFNAGNLQGSTDGMGGMNDMYSDPYMSYEMNGKY